MYVVSSSHLCTVERLPILKARRGTVKQVCPRECQDTYISGANPQAHDWGLPQHSAGLDDHDDLVP